MGDVTQSGMQTSEHIGWQCAEWWRTTTGSDSAHSSLPPFFEDAESDNGTLKVKVLLTGWRKEHPCCVVSKTKLSLQELIQALQTSLENESLPLTCHSVRVISSNSVTRARCQ